MTRDYRGNLIYRDGQLERVLNDYGYMDADGGFHYHIKDWQGNVRAVIDEAGALEEVNSYYPYGALMGTGAIGGGGSVQPYKYGGKELDRQAGLDWYDSQARMYDPLLGRTPTMDPKAEDYYAISPYAWCAANPIMFVDTDGMTLHIDGATAFDALQMLTERFERAGLHLDMDEKGNVSYTAEGGKKINKEAKRLMRVIDDTSIRAHITATEQTDTSEGDFYVGGAFMGNCYNSDGSVDAYQEVNTEVFGRAEDLSGQLMMHEITEAYEGGKLSQKNKSNASKVIGMSNKDSVYTQAHRKAVKQPVIYQTKYDIAGNITDNNTDTVRIEWSIINHNKTIVILSVP